MLFKANRIYYVFCAYSRLDLANPQTSFFFLSVPTAVMQNILSHRLNVGGLVCRLSLCARPPVCVCVC